MAVVFILVIKQEPFFILYNVERLNKKVDNYLFRFYCKFCHRYMQDAFNFF